MKFVKMHGCGNDYVFVNGICEEVLHPQEIAVRISDRHFGVGSDGLVVILPSEQADFRMQMYNADGSEAQMCGNAIRCLAKYVYDTGLTDKTMLTIETKAGLRSLWLTLSGGKVSEVKVNMGTPVTAAEQIPVIAKNSPVVAEPVAVTGHSGFMTCVSMGNPHAVFFTEDLETLDLHTIGPLYERHERFPERINVEFVKVLDRQTLQMRVWERGSGETLACGTGACAGVYAAILNGYTEDTVLVKLSGGELQIEFDRQEQVMYMTGSAVKVFEGEWQNVRN